MISKPNISRRVHELNGEYGLCRNIPFNMVSSSPPASLYSNCNQLKGTVALNIVGAFLAGMD